MLRNKKETKTPHERFCDYYTKPQKRNTRIVSVRPKKSNGITRYSNYEVKQQLMNLGY